jgi:protein FAM50
VQHYDFYYFLVNKTVGYQGRLFDYSAEPTAATPTLDSEADDEANYDPLAPKKAAKVSNIPDDQLEGYDDDGTITKVVDRRWFEKNKHIYPATLWEEYDSTKDYTKGVRKDASGNVLFFT